MTLSVQSRLMSAVSAQQRSAVPPAAANALRFGSTDSTSGDVFFRQPDDYPGVRPPTPVSPIRNTVPQPVAQLQQARSLGELLTVLDRRTGYLAGQKHGICPDRSKDGPIEVGYSDGTVLKAELTVPPQLADTHVLHKDLRLAGGNSAWDRPYRYTAVPEAIAGKVPTYASETGGITFSMSDLMNLLHSQPQTPSVISFGNRPSVAVSMERPDGTVVRFTIDTNIQGENKVPKDGDLPPVRIVNFSAVQMSMLGPDDPDPIEGQGVLVKGIPGFPENTRIVVRDVEIPKAEQQKTVASVLNALYNDAPEAMLDGTKWPVNVDRAITPGDKANEHNYTYPKELDSLVFQYRYGMGHYEPEKKR